MYFSGTKIGARRRAATQAVASGGPDLEQPDVERDDVPVGGPAEEEVVLGLRVELREAVGAREHGRARERQVGSAPIQTMKTTGTIT